MRAETFARQKELGVIPADSELTVRHPRSRRAEGSLQGTFNEMITLQGFGHLENAEFLTERIDKFGSGLTLRRDSQRNDRALAPFVFSGDETFDIGYESGSPVTDDYPGNNKFSGEVNWVQLDIGDDAIRTNAVPRIDASSAPTSTDQVVTTRTC